MATLPLKGAFQGTLKGALTGILDRSPSMNPAEVANAMKHWRVLLAAAASSMLGVREGVARLLGAPLKGSIPGSFEGIYRVWV